MDKLPTCDICGRSEKDLQRQILGGSLQIERDEDVLWICAECKSSVRSEPLGSADDDHLDARLKELV